MAAGLAFVCLVVSSACWVNVNRMAVVRPGQAMGWALAGVLFLAGGFLWTANAAGV